MSLPTWTRKSPRTASVAAAISALALMAAGSASFADEKAKDWTQAQAQSGYAQQLYGQQGYGAPQGYAAQQQGYWSAPLANPYGKQDKAAAPQSYATTAGYPSAYAGYGAVAASAYAQAPASVVGYGQPVVEGYAPRPPHTGVPVPAGYAAQIGGFAPGYAVPGATGVPAYGADPYAAFPAYGYSPFGYAPAEPVYAPAERAGATAPAAPAPVASTPVAAAPAPAAPVVEPANATTGSTTSGYSYEATSGSSTYVGSTTELSRDPYTAITTPAPAQAYQTYTAPAAQAQQPAYQVQQPAYQAHTPSYTQYEQAAPAPAPVPAPSYEAYQAAPAPAPTPTYEYAAPTTAPADYVDLGTSGALVTTAPAQAYESYVQPGPRSGHMVQVAAFRDANRANGLVDKLRSAGEDAFAVEALVRGKTFYRVRVTGGSKGAAREARNRVRNLGYYEATIVKG